MTTATTPELSLSSDDVQAMKAASRFVVRLEDGRAKLQCIKHDKGRTSGPFSTDPAELERTIVCEAQRVKACFVRMYPDGAWQALARLVRPGDRLIFRANANNNGYLDAAIIPIGKLRGPLPRVRRTL